MLFFLALLSESVGCTHEGGEGPRRRMEAEEDGEICKQNEIFSQRNNEKINFYGYFCGKSRLVLWKGIQKIDIQMKQLERRRVITETGTKLLGTLTFAIDDEP